MAISSVLSRGLIPSARAFVDSCLCSGTGFWPLRSLTLCSIGSRAHFDPGRAFGLSAPSFDCVPSTIILLIVLGGLGLARWLVLVLSGLGLKLACDRADDIIASGVTQACLRGAVATHSANSDALGGFQVLSECVERSSPAASWSTRWSTLVRRDSRSTDASCSLLSLR